MPSAGENFGHSLFESMLAGTPVITSQNTPWRNLENAHSGWDIDLNDKPAFQKVIEFCLKISQTEYDILSENTFLYAKKYSESVEIINLYKQLFDWKE